MLPELTETHQKPLRNEDIDKRGHAKAWPGHPEARPAMETNRREDRSVLQG
jgi:hypothetical protein